MVIRVSKPEINLRDKLSQLELPVGPYGSSLMRADNKMEAARIVGVGRKNMIRNGNFSVNQKSGTFTNIASNHIFDGWYGHDSTNGSIAATIAEATPYPPECSKYIQIQCTGTDNNLSSGQYVSLSCSIEGTYFQQAQWGTRHAKDLTLSFYHRHTRPGVYSGCFRNAAANYNYVFEYTQEQADTWELAEIQIIGEQTSSWTTGNGKALNLNWSLGDETSVSDGNGKWFSGQYYHASTRQINMMTNTSNYFRMTAVQLEVGKGKTPFDDIGYESMLAWCQRYFFNVKGDNQYRSGIPGFANSTTNLRAMVQFPVPMRATPTVSGTATAMVFDAQDDSASFNCNALVAGGGLTNTDPHMMVIEVNTSGMTNGQAGVLEFRADNGSINFSAEL